MAAKPLLKAPWGEYLPRVGRMTVEQFEQFPGADGWSYELHDGRLISIPGPGDEHALIQGRCFTTLGVFLEQHGLGELQGTGCYNLPLPNQTEEVLCPDCSYVQPPRRAAMPLRGSYRVGAPDLVIEIASPGDTHPELANKAAVYLLAGVRLIWIIWPKTRTIEVWRAYATPRPWTKLTERDELDGLDVVAGFRSPVSRLFPS